MASRKSQDVDVQESGEYSGDEMVPKIWLFSLKNYSLIFILYGDVIGRYFQYWQFLNFWYCVKKWYSNPKGKQTW